MSDYLERYADLLLYLSGKPFTWSMKRDQDRARNGLALRKNFSEYSEVDPDFWVGKMPDQCSMLEMMIALAMACDDIIFDPDYGTRTAEWFWMMVDNLGLSNMDKYFFDKEYCDEVVDVMLKRRYFKNGRGGLFTTRNPKIDMRKAEIWYQANVWLEENFD